MSETKPITDLIDKAEKSSICDDAMRYSQAALNAAHALQVLEQIKRENPKV